MIEEADEEGYEHLEILERDDICQEELKEKIQKEYYKRFRAVLKSKLNGGNVINAINIWIVATVWYGTGIITWNKGELDKIEQQTQKWLNMYRGLHPRFSADRFYIPRAQGDKGLLSVKECDELERSKLSDYAASNNERVLKIAKIDDGKNKEDRENERQAAWKEKELHLEQMQ